MRILIKSFILFCLLSGIVLYPHKALALEDAIIAVVNDEVITLKDLRSYIHGTYVSLVAEGLSEDHIKEAMLDLEISGLDRLIEDKLILSRANKIKLEVKQKLVEDRMDEIKKRYGSEDAFLENLIKNGASVTDLRNKVTEQLKIKFVIDLEVRQKIYVNPQEVSDYYRQNITDFIKKEMVSLDSIFVVVKSSKDKAREKIDQALLEIKSGIGFKEVASKFSDAPSIGTIEKGQTLPIIENTVFRLNEGEVSDVIEVDAGFYIFKLLGKKPAEQADIKEVKDQVNSIVFRKKFKAKFESWIAKLKKEAYVEIKK